MEDGRRRKSRRETGAEEGERGWETLTYIHTHSHIRQTPQSLTQERPLLAGKHAESSARIHRTQPGVGSPSPDTVSPGAPLTWGRKQAHCPPLHPTLSTDTHLGCVGYTPSLSPSLSPRHTGATKSSSHRVEADIRGGTGRRQHTGLCVRTAIMDRKLLCNLHSSRYLGL